jgi:hypothetical protein
MAETTDTTIWVTVGSAIGGIFAGIGSILGINRFRGGKPVENREVALNNGVTRTEIDVLRSDLSAAQQTLAQHSVFIDTVKQIHDSLKRIHERIDMLDVKLARMEGFDAGVKSMGKGT